VITYDQQSRYCPRATSTHFFNKKRYSTPRIIKYLVKLSNFY